MKDMLIKAIELLESISLHRLGDTDANILICAVRLLEDIYGENYIKVNVERRNEW